jgi:mannosyltransferase
MNFRTIMQGEWSPVRIRIVLALLVAFAAILSFTIFLDQSLRLDEAQSLFQTSHSLSAMYEIVGKDVHVPMYHTLLRGWTVLFGNDVAVARTLSLLFFLASIPAIYLLGKVSYGVKAGMYAATLLAISPLMNWYGNEIRMYSLFVLLTILSQYLFLRIMKGATDEAWLLFFLVSVFGIYTHYFYFLILLTNTVFFLFNQNLFPAKTFKKMLVVFGALFCMFLPWLANVYNVGGPASSVPNLQAPTSVNVFNTFSNFLFGFQVDHLNTVLLSLWPITVFLGFLALRTNKKVSPVTVFFLLSFLLPNVIAFLISSTLSPVYLTRYLIFTMPAMYMLLIWLFSTYPDYLARICRWLLVIIMLVSLAIEAFSAHTPVKEDYREAAAYLHENALSSDVVVVSAPFTIYPMLYYYRGSSSMTTLPIWDQTANGPIPPYSEGQIEADLEKIRANHRFLWLLMSYDQGYEEDLRIYMDTHLERLDVREFSPGLTLYVYKLRYD